MRTPDEIDQLLDDHSEDIEFVAKELIILRCIVIGIAIVLIVHLITHLY